MGTTCSSDKQRKKTNTRRSGNSFSCCCESRDTKSAAEGVPSNVIEIKTLEDSLMQGNQRANNQREGNKPHEVRDASVSPMIDSRRDDGMELAPLCRSYTANVIEGQLVTTYMASDNNNNDNNRLKKSSSGESIIVVPPSYSRKDTSVGVLSEGLIQQELDASNSQEDYSFFNIIHQPQSNNSNSNNYGSEVYSTEIDSSSFKPFSDSACGSISEPVA